MVLLVMGYVHIGREKQHRKASEICKNLLLQFGGWEPSKYNQPSVNRLLSRARVSDGNCSLNRGGWRLSRLFTILIFYFQNSVA
ncbi:hypothetical protein I3843_09G165200 [Carya illinoinensis]|nr:hypothetical protein I3843_09G165200 [Carya illinoinensis]